MSCFSKNDSVIINGTPVTVSEFINGGGQGEVYKAVNYKESEYQALKFLFGDYAPEKDKKTFYDRTVILTKAEPLHPAFAWPSGVGEFDAVNKCFAYTMPLKVGYEATSKLIKYPKRVPVRQKAKVALKALDAFCTLEDNGFIYTDVSDGNILYRITSLGEADVAIIDCENITMNRLTLGLQGTGLFRAPEVLLGKAPTNQSVIHALSVWVYRLLVAGVHPLNGSSQKNILFDDNAVLEHYGRNPEFVFSGGKNRPYPSAEAAWNELPRLMQLYFSYTFSDEVLKGKKPRLPIRYMRDCIKKAYCI